MSSRRIQQVNALIQEELGKILLKEFEVPPGIMLTITSVDTSSDRDHVVVKVSIYPNNASSTLFETLTRKQRYFQHFLNQKLVMEHVPTIHFQLDTLEAHAEEIERLIDEVSK